MKVCPKCGKYYERLLAVSRSDNKTMICDQCGVMEALASLPPDQISPQDRTRIAVMAKNNKWATENSNAIHS